MKCIKLQSAVLVLLTISYATAAVAQSPIRKPDAFNPDDRTVDVFKAMEAGELEVRLIPKDAKEGMLLIENKTDKPLNVKLPEAFAGVPVLAQMGGMGMGGMGGMGGGGAQGMGMGMGGMGGGMGGMGGGMGGMFNVAPDKVGKVKVIGVCLEHGKPDPTPRLKYTIKPIETLTDKPAVIEVCKMFVRGEIDQASAQAAAWHLQDGLTWQELAFKEKVRLSNGYVEMYFNRANLAVAMQATGVAAHRAKSQLEAASPGEQQGAE